MTRTSRGTKPAAGRKDAVARLSDEVRRMGALTVLMSKVVATRFGLHPTDLECLDLIFLRGGASAGELAEATGLTSGAMTAVIDRLERKGYVRRVADPNDRRRREVHIRPEAIRPIQAVYAPIQRRMSAVSSTYSERDLTLIAEFIAKSTEVSVGCIEALQRQ